MSHYVTRAGLQVAGELADFVERQLLPGLSLGADAFWQGFASLLADLAPENRRLLAVRDQMQARIDAWLTARRGQGWDNAAWQDFLREIGYLLPEGPEFSVATTPSDPEIASVAGAQLVVPVMNARFALNAANARWGSLYDALYGTDALPGAPAGKGYDAVRGAQAVAWAAGFLDQAVPLATGSHAEVTEYVVQDGALVATLGAGSTGLADPSALAGMSGDGAQRSILLRHNGLHIELVFDPSHPVGAASRSGLRDVVLESALTAIQDCEDSVAAVDAADKVLAYANWLGLMKGDLTESFDKGGKVMTRRLNPDRSFATPDGSTLTLPGRAVLLVRNVGHLMTTDAVLLDGQEVPEGLMDAMVTVTAALHDLQKTDGPRNSRSGSVYVVKPKMHGPDEAAFADRTYAMVERLLGLPFGTVKLGLMDEERRTSANLRECIRALKDRIVFINTGFLDRTGDEIHTVMQAGPVLPKAEIRTAPWLSAYEDGNVDAGLATGMRGKGQIGKGMWAKPDAMAEMLTAKIGHPQSGATTAWVPSPTAATLHATHYHLLDVAARQADLATRARASLDALMTPPLMGRRNLSAEQIAYELDLNCQSILGYVVRWVDQGVGCSKVPDIDDVALMEDRATLRISAQFLANWLMHGLITETQLDESLRRMAVAVDRQNAGDPAYCPMAPGYDGPAFQAARDLIVQGATQPSGYTEPLLHAWRRVVKAA
ncbi:malate synthase [Gemmobacter megaterium]|uniref:Malate synthase G n=1 Tax=Gemmobacter megaterium TaxID=1086013 RepID=A0A1N7N358_9RHOB|nr:malate synthase G [Gemmobacter megaterium]GGE12817.1 malate synthase G [Gemmobacter megaterium]SIS92782.1 malate synthase [Gemmobacter megaterium]